MLKMFIVFIWLKCIVHPLSLINFEFVMQAELSQKESFSVYNLLCICFKHFIII